VNPLAARAVGGFARTASGLFVVLGTLGLVRGHFDGFTSSHGVRLLSFTASPLTNVILLAAGLVGITMALRLESARNYALWVGAIGVPWGLLEFVLGDGSADIFGRDTGLALLTIGVGVAGLAVWAWSRPAPHDADPELPVG
jgi:hypothetical protein